MNPYGWEDFIDPFTGIQDLVSNRGFGFRPGFNMSFGEWDFGFGNFYKSIFGVQV